MLKKLKAKIDCFKREVKVYQLVLKDQRTPRLAKFFLGAAVAYALSPVDIIPDFIPVIGFLDDILVVPLLVIIAVKLTPKKIIDDCREQLARK